MSNGKVKRDPWDLDVEAQGSIRDEMRGRRQRALCRKSNKAINDRCFGCEKVSQMFASRDPQQIDLAKQLNAKASLYLNVVFPENKDKVVILEIGSSVGNEIIDGIEKKGWGNITQQKEKKGREINILKTKTSSSSFPTYRASPALEAVSYDISEKVLNKRYDLSNIIDLIKTEDIFKIASLRVDESLTFKILPAWDDGQGNKKIMKPVWYHWGLSEDEVAGETDINVNMEQKEETTPWEAKPAEETLSESSDIKEEAEKDPCFGRTETFEEDDSVCEACADVEECKVEVLKKLKAAKLKKIES